MSDALKQTCTTLIAIDPDVDRNGVACIDMQKKSLSIHALKFPETLDYLHHFASCQDVKVIIEAGWINKSNWHIACRDSRRNAAAKGNAVGRNHEVGRKLAEMCEHWGIPCQLVKPLRKVWRGKDGKITATELQSITGYKGRTNQEGRDAALLSWVYAGLPIVIQVDKCNVRDCKVRY